VEERPEQVRRLAEAGMEIGNHSWSHQRMVLKSSGFYDEEIARTQEAVVAAGAPEPTLFRPPFGKKLVGLPRAVDRAGLTAVMWSVEDDLSGTLTPQEYADRIVAEAEPASIILKHVMCPSSQIARDALPLVLDGLGAKGLKAVSVTELLSVTARP